LNLSQLPKFFNTAIFLFVAFIYAISPAQAQMQQVTILPFSIHAKQDLTYLKEGISQMLSTRLAWKEKVMVVPEKTILDEVKKTPRLSGVPLVKFILKHTDVKYVVSGSITEFAGAFSLDTAIYTDTSGIPMHTFFGQANSPDDIIPEMNTIAAQINHAVFNRDVTTLTDNNAQRLPAKENLTRVNPNNLIPQVSQNITPKKKPFWEFWKKESPPAYPDETVPSVETTVPQEEEKIPFWKFWKKKKSDNNTDEMDSDAVGNPGKDEGEDDTKKPFWKFW